MASSSRFVDHRFPYALGPEHKFNRFPYRPVPGEGLRRIVRSLLYLRHGITHRNRESGTTQQREIRKVVPDKRDSGIGDASFSKNLLVRWHFYRLFHVDELHLHFVGAAQERGAFPPSNAARAEAGGLREGEPLAVVRVERLNFQGRAISLRKQGDTPIRHRTVNVHE